MFRPKQNFLLSLREMQLKVYIIRRKDSRLAVVITPFNKKAVREIRVIVSI